jgi:hypothetical protein
VSFSATGLAPVSSAAKLIASSSSSIRVHQNFYKCGLSAHRHRVCST